MYKQQLDRGLLNSKLLFISALILSSFTCEARLASQINGVGEKIVIVDPRSHQWGAYDARGYLVRSGLASAGSNYCKDLGRQCHTHAGTYRIFSLGDAGCYSARFPLPNGGAPMPYCMYFNGNQALHGSPNVVNGNISHGCVRMRTSDAAWMRYNFAERGTLVHIMSY